LGGSALFSKDKYIQLAVPEPSGIALAAFGFAALAAWGLATAETIARLIAP
jgi:hypothetical protein